MVPRKEDSRDRSGRTVKFASTEADQSLLKLVEQALEERSVSFSDLCKQALQHFLRLPELSQSAPLVQTSDANTSKVDAPIDPDVIALQHQMDALRLQVAKLEGALGMYQTVTLGQIEQQVAQVEQHMTIQLAHVLDRLDQLEQGKTEPQLTPDAAASRVEPIESLQIEPPQGESQEIDPLLTRLAPLLEDF